MAIMRRRRHDVHVLFGPTFATFEPSVAANKALIEALRSRGAQITALWCDQAQSDECAVYGGVWGGGDEFAKNCFKCARASESEARLGDATVRASSALSPSAEGEIQEFVRSLREDELAELMVDGYPVGQAARQIMSNMWTTETWEDIPNSDSLLRIHVANLLRLNVAYTKTLDSGSFNRVVCNDSSYGMWGLLHHQAALRKIPAYSLWPVGGSRVATGDVRPAMQPDFREPWSAFQSRKLTDLELAAVKEFLSYSCGGGGGRISLGAGTGRQTFATAGSKDAAPVVVLAANVVWDLASYGKQRVFRDVESLVRATIEWFSTQHGDAKLVIRSHPVESDPALPRTRKTLRGIVERELSDAGLEKPDWLVVDESSVPLEHWLRLGANLVVNTSTTGAVAAARGAPVIVTGDAPYLGLGLGHEPQTEEEYFELLASAAIGRLPAKDPELALKYLLLQNFVYYSDWDAYRRADWLRTAPRRAWRPKKRSEALNHVADRIMSGERVMSSEALPPVTLPR